MIYRFSAVRGRVKTRTLTDAYAVDAIQRKHIKLYGVLIVSMRKIQLRKFSFSNTYYKKISNCCDQGHFKKTCLELRIK